MKVALLKLFLMTGSDKYARNLLCDLLVFAHQHRVAHPINKLLKVDPHCFNEEAGEISLAVLARLNLGMTDKRSFEIMNQRYQLTKPALLIAHYLNPRMRKQVVPKRTKKYNIDVNGMEVNTTITFFKSVIRACIANQHQAIDIGSSREIKTRSAMNNTLKKANVMPVRQWWEEGEVIVKYDAQIEHIRTKWFEQPYLQFSHRWFEEDFVEEVRRRQARGQEWQSMFDLVPDALTSDESDTNNSSDAHDDVSDVSDSDMKSFVGDHLNDDFENEVDESDSPGMQEQGADLISQPNSASRLDIESFAAQHDTVPEGSESAVHVNDEESICSSSSDDDSDNEQHKESKALEKQNRKRGRSMQRRGRGVGNRIEDTHSESRRLARQKRPRQGESGFYSLVAKYGTQK